MVTNGSSLLEFVLRVASFQLPLLIVAVVGIWYALRHRARYPRVAVIAVAGLGALAAGELASVWMLAIVSPALSPSVSGPDAGSLLATWGFATNLTWLAALVLLLVAVYTERGA